MMNLVHFWKIEIGIELLYFANALRIWNDEMFEYTQKKSKIITKM